MTKTDSVVERELRTLKAEARVLLAALERQTMRTDVTGKCIYSLNVENGIRRVWRLVSPPPEPEQVDEADVARPA